MQSALYEKVTPLAGEIRRSGLSGRRLDALCKKYGISRPIIEKYAQGRGRPAPWLARALAREFRGDVDVLFPRRTSDRED